MGKSILLMNKEYGVLAYLPESRIIYFPTGQHIDNERLVNEIVNDTIKTSMVTEKTVDDELLESLVIRNAQIFNIRPDFEKDPYNEKLRTLFYKLTEDFINAWRSLGIEY